MRRHRILLALIPATLLLASCNASGSEPRASAAPRSGPHTSSAAAPTLLTYHDNGNHMLAAFKDARLSVNEAGCFALRDGSTIMLPDTWSVSSDGDGIVNNDDGTEVRVGDHFDAAGGFGGPPRRNLTLEQRRCPSDGPPFSNGGKYKSFAGLWGISPR
jgi:hypothetical protein